MEKFNIVCTLKDQTLDQLTLNANYSSITASDKFFNGTWTIERYLHFP